MNDSAHSGAGGSEWVAISPDDLTWVTGPYGETAVVWGDPSAGPYGAFDRFPAGTIIPPHVHGHDNQLIVVSGSLHSYRLDDDAQTRSRAFAVGSFVYESADVPHVLAVDSGESAVVYSTQAGPLDLTLVEQDDPGWDH